jgi:hypothetical protein
MRPLSTSLLLTMRRGRIYTASNLGRLLGEKADAVEQALCELVADGSVEACNKSMNVLGYRRSELMHVQQTAHPDTRQEAETSVATSPVTRRLEGSLSGYSASIERHRVLAMLVRR